MNEKSAVTKGTWAAGFSVASVWFFIRRNKILIAPPKTLFLIVQTSGYIVACTAVHLPSFFQIA